MEGAVMLTIKAEYLRLRAARLRQSAKNLGPDPEAQKVWQLAEDMETLAVEMEQRSTPRQPRAGGSAQVAG
jgi:O-acetylhomoserine/O-acetylserine sulfhydrylase-like pyridoxal-dependent enzyme